MTMIISNTYAIMKCPPDTLEAHTVAVDARSKPGMTQLVEPVSSAPPSPQVSSSGSWDNRIIYSLLRISSDCFS